MIRTIHWKSIFTFYTHNTKLFPTHYLASTQLSVLLALLAALALGGLGLVGAGLALTGLVRFGTRGASSDSLLLGLLLLIAVDHLDDDLNFRLLGSKFVRELG